MYERYRSHAGYGTVRAIWSRRRAAAGVVDDGPPGAAVRAALHRRPAHTVVCAGVVETVISGQDVKAHAKTGSSAQPHTLAVGGERTMPPPAVTEK
jgi:hypothetical protein